MYIFSNKQLATVWIKSCVDCNFNDNRVICCIKCPGIARGGGMGSSGIDWYITSGIVLALSPLTSFARL